MMHSNGDHDQHRGPSQVAVLLPWWLLLLGGVAVLRLVAPVLAAGYKDLNIVLPLATRKMLGWSHVLTSSPAATFGAVVVAVLLCLTLIPMTLRGSPLRLPLFLLGWLLLALGVLALALAVFMPLVKMLEATQSGAI